MSCSLKRERKQEPKNGKDKQKLKEKKANERRPEKKKKNWKARIVKEGPKQCNPWKKKRVN